MADETSGIGAGYRRIAALPLPVRRRAVRWLARLEALSAALTRSRRQRATGSEAVHLFQRVLRLSRREARRLEREARLHDLAAETEWHALHRRSLLGIRCDMARIRVEGADLLERAAGGERPVILAPLHMGAYVLALGHTILRFFPGRPLLVLRQRDDMPMETQVIERLRACGVDLRFLQVTERADFLAAVRFARKGAVIVVFCDLPPAYGAPAAMPMFGLPLHFAFGVDALARLTGATVLPFVTTMECGGDRIRVGTPFEISGNGPEERAHAAGLMRAHIREALRTRPEQWHLWSTLPDYLPPDGTIEETQSRTAQAADRPAPARRSAA